MLLYIYENKNELQLLQKAVYYVLVTLCRF